jgi:hypothetical protein
MADTPQAVLYEESVRSITRQQAALDNARSRAGTLLAAAAIVTSFLGAEALKDPGGTPGSSDRSLQYAELTAIGAFIALAVAVVVVLWPRKFTFRISAKHYLTNHIKDPSNDLTDEASWSTERLQRNLALWIEKHVIANQRKINQLLWAFRLGCVLLAVEVVAWLIDLT